MASARRPAHRGAARRRPPRVVPAAAPAPPPLAAEEPHAHIVCRVCGRIQGMELSELDAHLLTELAGRRPNGWSVERIAFSVAGACQRCREGAAAP